MTNRFLPLFESMRVLLYFLLNKYIQKIIQINKISDKLYNNLAKYLIKEPKLSLSPTNSD